MKKNISLPNNKMEDFIYMSYRYCIGRHTGAAAGHAETIHKLLLDNPEILNEDRRSFMAEDIRREINHVVDRHKNVYIEGMADFDAFSTLLYYVGNVEIESHKFKFNVDSRTGTVDTEDITPIEPWESFENDYIDLIGWVKLANFLDKKCHKIVEIYYDDDFIEYEAYPYPQKINGKYLKVWCSIGHDFNGWLDPTYIVEIKDL